MARLLIVSPHFPPTNAADHQRVRIALPHLLSEGWDVEVLAVDPRDVIPAEDPFLLSTLPEELRVTRVRANVGRWSCMPGLGSLGYRATAPLRRAVVAALTSRPESAGPTLIYFSTTQFPVHRMIPRLRARHHVKVVMDIQDPWGNDYYAEHPDVKPPGGRLRFWVSDRLARIDESRVLPWVDGITSVSPAYREMLLSRYPGLAKTPFLTLPFGAAEQDFRAIDQQGITQSYFKSGTGRMNWIYVGRGGRDMHRALRPFFVALREAITRMPELDNLRVHFIGTDYASATRAQESIMPLARETGVDDRVRERPERIPYAEALRCLRDADALIVPGSDDPRYTASKLYPYLLAGKPMLSIFHEDSPGAAAIRMCRAGPLVTFSPTEDSDTIQQRVWEQWFEPRAFATPPRLDVMAFAPYTAREMTLRLSDFLRTIISDRKLSDS